MSILSLILLLYPLVTNSYKPDYNLAINCGSSTNATASDNRIWVGEHKTIDNNDNSNLFNFIEPKPEDNTLPNIQIPYTTARYSFLNFTYSIPISTSFPVFIRLHFYPTSYENFEPSYAIFSVEVNSNLTFLKNFKPSLWTNKKPIIKEYCIQIKPNENLLNITFIPNNIDKSNHYYAFINGIEVVSMPSFLYYTDLNDTNYHLKSLDFDNAEYQIRSDKVLEMVYRVNVGQNQVPPSNDTGMFRNWENDFPLYLEKQYPQSISSGFGEHLNYLKIPNYTAPEDVYLTARSYGMYVTEDYNVTWNFEVDSTFTYMVRLHFCEFDELIKDKGDRVFQIFIDDILAEQYADVLLWSGGRLVPVHKDYAVTVYSPKGSSQIERVNISIKLQRMPTDHSTLRPTYRDVILNGIEILKVSDKNKNLASSNPKSIAPSLPHQSSKIFKITKAIIVVITFSGLVLAIVLGITFSWLRRRFHSERDDNSSKTKNEGSSSLPPHLCRYFTIAEIRSATNNFDDDFIIGVGGFGNVYKGCIDGSTLVAIKRLKSGSQQGANEFMNDIELLSQLRHIHLVSLVGYCSNDTEMILVYEFMQRGTLGIGSSAAVFSTAASAAPF